MNKTNSIIINLINITLLKTDYIFLKKFNQYLIIIQIKE